MATALETLRKEQIASHDSEFSVVRNKIETRQARVGIIGLGYVGLPLAIGFAKAGFNVTGFDVDPIRVQTMLQGKSHIEDVPSEDLKGMIDRRRFVATTNFARLSTLDAVIICVPTPLNKTKDPDISFIASATEQIAKYLRKQQLIVLESTTYPGTTREFMLPLLEKQGLKVGRDFYLAFSPERIDPSNKKYQLTNTPKVVGGITAACSELAALLYDQVVDRVVPVSNAETAELVKLLENTFRAVNIGLVNEIALICDKLKLNVWEVIDAAATKPYGFMPFYPGPGLGGHCIPIDPHYLSWKMKALNFSARFIELAGEVNSHMPEFVAEKAALALNSKKKAVNGAQIVVMGVTYKANVSDMRESPALDVIHILMEQGAEVSFHDPYVKTLNIGGKVLQNRPLTPSLLKSADLVIVTTAHSVFKAQDIVANSQLVLDTRNIAKDIHSENLIRL